MSPSAGLLPILIFTGNRGCQIHVLLDRFIYAEHYEAVFSLLRAGFVERRVPRWVVEATARKALQG